jgi:FKBP-type peptidyl-prolyl cis-trans isomerase SlyD
MTIEKGKDVKFHYTLKVEGEVVDSSVDREPLEYVHGEKQIISGLAEELEGMAPGEKKAVKISPEKGYGQVRPEAFQEVPKGQFPENVELKPGQPLQVKTPDGMTHVVRITEVKDDTVVLDMNHPLAGKTLDFDIEIVSVQ